MALFSAKKSFKRLSAELERLVTISGQGNLDAELNGYNLTQDEAEIAHLINAYVRNHKLAFEYELTKYKLASDAINVAFWDMNVVDGDPVNPRNTFVWSDKLRRMLGFKDESDFPNVLASWSDRLHPDDSDRVLSGFAEYLLDRSGKILPYDMIYRLKKKDGEYRYFRAISSVLRGSAGVPLRVAGIFEDIDDKLRAQKQIEEEQETMKSTNMRLSLMIKGMNIALWDMAVDQSDHTGSNNEFWWSDEFRHMLGFNNQSDFPNVLSSWSDRLHPEDKKPTLDAFAAHLGDKTGKTPYDLFYRLKLKNGEYRVFHAFGATIRDAEGNPQRVAGAVKDVTEEKLMQEELAQKQANIEKNNQYVNKLMKDVEAVSKIISDGARIISDTNSNLARGVSTQADAIDELDSLVSGINKKMDNVYQSAATANDLSKNARQSAISGSEEMQSMLDSIEGIKSASGDIAKIIQTIESIAFQTNLLALNATVEAARAGTHGKGFAVVAEEVGNLARRAQTAAKETSGLIMDTIGRVERGSQIAKDTSKTFEKIVNDFEKVSEIVNQVALSSSEESEALRMVVKNIGQISDITQENSSTSEETAQTSQELADQSNILMGLFKSHDNKGGGL